jgi:uncharacterized protein YbaR (Trm112 family)
MHKEFKKLRLMHCPYCGGHIEPNETQEQNKTWGCSNCKRVWFIRLIG